MRGVEELELSWKVNWIFWKDFLRYFVVSLSFLLSICSLSLLQFSHSLTFFHSHIFLSSFLQFSHSLTILPFSYFSLCLVNFSLLFSISLFFSLKISQFTQFLFIYLNHLNFFSSLLLIHSVPLKKNLSIHPSLTLSNFHILYVFSMFQYFYYFPFLLICLSLSHSFKNFSRSLKISQYFNLSHFLSPHLSVFKDSPYKKPLFIPGFSSFQLVA